MNEKEQCGDYKIYQDDNGWWVVENLKDGKIIGKFQKKTDALNNIARFLQDDTERVEPESVC